MRLRWTRPALRDLSDIHAYIAYRVTEEFVDILALRHGARLWPGLLPAT